ncbi:MAG: valine--tRNA ligase [Candidatus Omnitrophica bacterium]|nr:valine--tRNA ligase [Candidatus Omnitrophota bacterium]
MELSSKYNPKESEEKWLKVWKDGNVFHAVPNSNKKPFTVVIPPPNVTGILHMGHALNNTLQDILIRYKRMNGFEALWMPGTDHAGIATQNVVEKQLAKEGKKRQDLGREEFTKRLWSWKKEYGDTIIHQLEKIGSSCDWPRTRFTMDDEYSEAVKEVFIRLFEKDLLYRGERIINWCPRCQTALSDEEAEHQEKNGKLYYLLYTFKDKTLSFPNAFIGNPEAGSPTETFGDDKFPGIVVATTRPETMLGDVAVAVNPQDPRYAHLIGQTLILPLVNREIKIIADDFVAAEFGTGAVKVTPAHDPNDFAMGQRHNLSLINVMHPDARINEKGGAYSGMDRFDARKKILADLEAQGLLVKMEDHKNSVGHCYRCDTVVEPYLSKQWFVKMRPLAKPALEAVKNGTIKIRPERWEKVYINWLEDTRDWCISRQIWWGHRIPVWYDKDGHVFVAKSETEAKAKAKAQHGHDVDLRQDEDVLDTWFSSWLWPFATLGWPKENPDLKFFYPTAALFTASEIIFFWVARMVMAGYEFMGKPPFTDVIIHGTVRDAKGRKMSKSLGNALDPLEIIEEYGADALRFSLIYNSGQDIYISKEKFEIGRNFANKIWNASRLVFTNCNDTLEKGDYENLDVKALDLPSRWIIGRFYETLAKTSNAIETYHNSEAEVLVQEFFWGSFCDWYLELIKAKWNDVNVQKTALFVLKNSLKLMHPFIPFVTEEIYSRMNTEGGCLSQASWPVLQKELIDQRAFDDMQTVIDVITAIRNIRTQWNVKPNETVDVILVPDNEANAKLLLENQGDIQRLGKLKTITVDAKVTAVKESANAVVGTLKVFIPLGGLVDLIAEKKRMQADIAVKQRSIDGLQSRLSNEAFVSKAPEDIIVKEKERLATLHKEIAELNKIVADLN